MKIYSFFSKYGCVDASTVHIKLTKKDYEQFASGGMAKQWNRALERWVHDKIQQWDWKNFHNTLAPKQNNEYSNSADSIKFLYSLLKFQEFSDDDIRYFCSAFYEIINKTSGKKNCIYIWGASSSGKTLLLNVVKRLLVRFGSYTEQSAFSEASYRTCFLFEDVSTIPIHSLSTITQLLVLLNNFFFLFCRMYE